MYFLFKKPSDFSRPSVSWFGVVVSVMSEVPITVSYTQLDVYKRQVVGSSAKLFGCKVI